MLTTTPKQGWEEEHQNLNKGRVAHFKNVINSLFKNIASPDYVPENIAITVSYLTISLFFLLDVVLDPTISFHLLYIFPLTFIALHSSRTSRVIGAVALSISLQFIELFFFRDQASETSVCTFLFIALANSICALGVRYARDHLLEVKHLSTIDPLTQLYNRRGFENAMNAEIARQRRYGGHFSVAVIDLDGFKGLNDSMGHAAGDKALTLFAAMLRNQLRQTDTISRFGGDEFVILMPNTQATDCNALCQLLCQSVCTSLAEALSYPISTSIGFTTIENSPQASGDILFIADRALYRAKALGKNCVARGYTEELTEEVNLTTPLFLPS